MNQENRHVRFTRAAKRRAEAAEIDGSAVKKRVVLGELSNVLRNDAVGATSKAKSGSEADNLKQQRKKKGKPSSKTKKASLPIAKPTAINTEDTATATKDKKSCEEEIEEKLEYPQMCVSYISDVYEYLHQMEVEPKRRPLPDYIERIQNDITPNMRGILVDWLVEVAEEYRLLSDTIFLSVSYIDRFLSMKTLPRQKLQLVGVSSLLIASKYEEIKPPRVEEFCYITDNTYTKEEAVKMEADILKSFEFELGSPTIKTFLRRYAAIAQENNKTLNLQLEFLGCYLAELSLLDYNCVKYLPSLVAASAIFLARFMIRPKMHPWTVKLQKYSRYLPSDLRPCVLIIHDLYLSRRGGSMQAIRAKYKQHRYKFVAVTSSPPEIPAQYFEDLRQ